MKIEYNVCLFFSDKSCCIMRQNGTFAPFKFYKEETAPPRIIYGVTSYEPKTYELHTIDSFCRFTGYCTLYKPLKSVQNRFFVSRRQNSDACIRSYDFYGELTSYVRFSVVRPTVRTVHGVNK